MYKRIVLLLDGSELAKRALPHAMALAEKFQAHLILLRVLEPLVEKLNLQGPGLDFAEELTTDIVQNYMETLAKDVREQGIEAEAVIISGRPHIEIIRYAENEQVDLIVFTTRGQSGVSRWLRGSIADRVARGSHVPVLIIPIFQNENP